MSQRAIVTDANRCVGCLSCAVACKMVNGVPVGNYWNRVVRVGPTPRYEGAQVPDVDLYFATISCQHCAKAPCVDVCPTGASTKRDDGTVQIDEDTCIGCGACLPVCPYGARYLDEDDGLAHKCTLCDDQVNNGELPECVLTCVGLARWYGDLDEQDIRDFKGPLGHTLGEVCEDFTDDDVHRLADSGNGPSFPYILRGMDWDETITF